MATPAEWSKSYARQAQADFRLWQEIEDNAAAQPCQRLMFLQMACEKLCKARLIDDGAPPEPLRKSHAYVAKPLPLIIRAQLEYMGEDLRKRSDLLKFTRQLAAEIEVLNPAVDRNEQRPDNCEYPWEDALLALHSPLDWSFSPLQLLQGRFGPTFVKVLKLAIDRVLEELQ